MKHLLILDSGHAEKVAGKRSPDSSLKEWEFNNDMQYRIKSRAEEHGIDVYLTNPSPKGKDEMGLNLRAQNASKYWTSKGKPKAMMISLHANAYGNGWTSANGTETFVAGNASSNSKNFAKMLNDQIVTDLKTRNRGVKVSNFTVIYKCICPCVLVEYGFYSNKNDVLMLKNKRHELTEASVKAICKYFGVSYKAPGTTSKPPISSGNPKPIKEGQYDSDVKITVNSLRVRKGAGTNFSQIGSVTKNKVVTLWRITKAKDGSLWGSFRYSPEHVGYICVDEGFVKPC